MYVRSACLLALAVAGCAANPTRVADSKSILDELRGQNKGIVLIDTPLRCAEMNAIVAHPDADGHYVTGETIAIVSILYLNGEPNQLVLPAGDYGLVDITCSFANATRRFVARPTRSGGLLSGEPAVYDQPIAKFSVRPGEIADIGSLQLQTSGSGFLGLQSNFLASVVPISESKLQAFADHKPALYSQLVRRPMVTPGLEQQPNQSTSPGAPNRSVPAPSGPTKRPDGKG